MESKNFIASLVVIVAVSFLSSVLAHRPYHRKCCDECKQTVNVTQNVYVQNDNCSETVIVSEKRCIQRTRGGQCIRTGIAYRTAVPLMLAEQMVERQICNKTCFWNTCFGY